MAYAAAVYEPRPVHQPDAKSGQVKVAILIEPRHLGCLASQQRRAGLPASRSDATHDLRGLVNIERTSRVVVKKKQRLGALHDDVVNAHRNQVNTNGIQSVELERQLELGADAIRSGDEQRILALAQVGPKQTTEAADITNNTRAPCACHRVLDGAYQRIACVNVNTGIPISQRLVLVHGRSIVPERAGIIVQMKLSAPNIALPSAVSLLLAGLLLAGGVVAETVTDIYSAEVESAADEPASRAFAEALRRVVVKVTGRRDAADSQVMAALGEPASFVQQYRRVASDRLRVGFDPVALKRRLDELNLPVWGESRPTTVLWLAVDGGSGRRQLLDAESPEGAQLREELLRAAEGRGLPVVLPLLDSEDLGQVSFSDVWGDFREPVVAASKRYRPDALLLGKLRGQDARFGRIRWTLVVGDEAASWSGGLAEGPGGAADRLAARLAAGTGGIRGIPLRVSGIEDLDSYGAVLNYLAALSIVEDCQVREVTGDRVLFDLKVRGQPDLLIRTLALGRLLSPDASADAASASELRYLLVGR